MVDEKLIVYLWWTKKWKWSKTRLELKRSLSAQFLSHRKAMLITFRITVFFKYLSHFLALSFDEINRASPKNRSTILRACLIFKKEEARVHPGLSRPY